MTTLSIIFLSLIFSFLAIILDIVLIKYFDVQNTLTVKRVIWLLFPVVNIMTCFISFMVMVMYGLYNLYERPKPKWCKNTSKAIKTFLNKQIYP